MKQPPWAGWYRVPPDSYHLPPGWAVLARGDDYPGTLLELRRAARALALPDHLDRMQVLDRAGHPGCLACDRGARIRDHGPGEAALRLLGAIPAGRWLGSRELKTLAAAGRVGSLYGKLSSLVQAGLLEARESSTSKERTQWRKPA